PYPLFRFCPRRHHRHPPPFPTRRSSDLSASATSPGVSSLSETTSSSTCGSLNMMANKINTTPAMAAGISQNWVQLTPSSVREARSEEHTSELQSRENLVCRLLLEKKKNR